MPPSAWKKAVEMFHPRLTMATAFGAEGCCILHMLAEIQPAVHVFNLDTGYQFRETLELRERIKARYGINVQYVRPEETVAEYEAEHGGPLYRHRPDQCCHDRKVLPLRRAVPGFDAWVSAIRGGPTQHPAAAPGGPRDAKVNLVKGKPPVHWPDRDRSGAI